MRKNLRVLPKGIMGKWPEGASVKMLRCSDVQMLNGLIRAETNKHFILGTGFLDQFLKRNSLNANY